MRRPRTRIIGPHRPLSKPHHRRKRCGSERRVTNTYGRHSPPQISHQSPQAPGCKPRGRIDGHRGRLVGWRNMGGYPTVCGARGNRIRSPDAGLTLGRRFDGLAPGPPPLPALRSRHRSFAGLPQAAGLASMPDSLGSGGYRNSVPARPEAHAHV